MSASIRVPGRQLIGAAADYRHAARLNPSLKQATEMLQKVETKL